MNSGITFIERSETHFTGGLKQTSKQLCEERRDGVETVEEALCGVGHNISL